MPHLMWNCEATQPLRDKHQIQLPVNRAEERLLCRLVARPPLTIVASNSSPVASPAFLRWLSNAITVQATSTLPLTFATDGGAKNGVSSWAVACEHEVGFGARIEGEDSTPLSAELTAILLVLQGLVSILASGSSLWDLRVLRSLALVVDCRAAMDLAQGTVLPTSRWLMVWQIRQHLEQLRNYDCPCSFSWVPSHGRAVPSWKPDARFGEKLLRDLNQRADEAATLALSTSLSSSRLSVSHETQCCRALAWSSSALALAIDICDQYDEFFDELVLHSSE